MVQPPKISPTIPKRRPEGPKVKWLRPPYKGQQPQMGPPPKRSIFKKVVKTVAITLGVTFFVFIMIGILTFTLTQPDTDQNTLDPKTPGDINDEVYKMGQKQQQDDNQDEPPDVSDQQKNNQKSGYCSSDPDCAAFGQRNGGPAICSSYDNLCHICYSLRGETCISGSTGCGGDPNMYVEKGVCVFKIGGRTFE